MKEYIQSKIQNICVTDKSLHYDGSVTICNSLMDAVKIDPYQKVDIVNLNNGQRWSTYAIPGKTGVFQLNGGSARLGEIGDSCVVMAYKSSTRFEGACVVHTNKYNKIEKNLTYDN